ncbi:MAG: DUF255 domain-containing protein [Reichenbachiella sp.]|uniref:DUF255 domain-containing protein n=1 Tax=Reichenbachiella sp. TaxID=2184521 RepID=UPI003263EC70
MKNLKWAMVFVIATLVGINNAEAGGDGIKFTKSSWDKVLKKAKKEGKNIFVDCYTTWCGPCKLMDKKTFTDPKVAAFYNENFINVKMDMETPEGLALNQYFYVSVYPTFLYLDSDGNTLEKATGYRPVDNFLELGQQALSAPIKKKYGKVNLVEEKKKENDLQKNKYFTMVKNAGYNVEIKEWETTMADAKATDKNIMAIYGDTYWPLKEEMTIDKNVKYLSENFELKVVSLMNSYVKDEDGEIVKDENDNLLVNDWLQKYSPSSYPGVVFINSNGDKLVDGGQAQATEIGQLVQKGIFKPMIGFPESIENAGLAVYYAKAKEEAFKKSTEENKPLMIMWYRTKGNDLHPNYSDEEVKSKLSKNFVLLALKRDQAPEIAKKYQYRGSGSLSVAKPNGELLNNYYGDPTMTKVQMLEMLDKIIQSVSPKKETIQGTGMMGIQPAKKTN